MPATTAGCRCTISPHVVRGRGRSHSRERAEPKRYRDSSAQANAGPPPGNQIRRGPWSRHMRQRVTATTISFCVAGRYHTKAARSTKTYVIRSDRRLRAREGLATARPQSAPSSETVPRAALPSGTHACRPRCSGRPRRQRHPAMTRDRRPSGLSSHRGSG